MFGSATNCTFFFFFFLMNPVNTSNTFAFSSQIPSLWKFRKHQPAAACLKVKFVWSQRVRWSKSKCRGIRGRVAVAQEIIPNLQTTIQGQSAMLFLPFIYAPFFYFVFPCSEWAYCFLCVSHTVRLCWCFAYLETSVCTCAFLTPQAFVYALVYVLHLSGGLIGSYDISHEVCSIYLGKHDLHLDQNLTATQTQTHTHTAAAQYLSVMLSMHAHKMKADNSAQSDNSKTSRLFILIDLIADAVKRKAFYLIRNLYWLWMFTGPAPLSQIPHYVEMVLCNPGSVCKLY